MDKKTFQNTFFFIVFKSLFVVLFFQSAFSAPVDSTISYDAFLKNVTRDNCAFPSGIVLPLKNSLATFQYFSELLKICKAPEAMKRSLEAVTLCNEIYDALKIITCQPNKNVELPKIEIEFSKNVCKDINSLQLQHTLEEKSLLQHLTDKFICEMMCEDDFLPACQVLLWSFQLRKRIEGIPLVQPIQNSLNQENKADAGIPLVQPIQNSLNQENKADAGIAIVAKTVDPDHKDSSIDKKHDTLIPNEVPAVDNSANKVEADQQTVKDDNSVNKVDLDQHIINDDIDNNDLDQTLKNSKDNNEEKVAKLATNEEKVVKPTNNEEKEIPEKLLTGEKKDSELNAKLDQDVRLDKPKEPEQIENKASKINEEPVATAIEKQQVINDQLTDDNKIDADVGSPKNSESPQSKTTLVKNNPAVPNTEDSNKTVPKKDITPVQNNLLPESPKENTVKVKPVETINENITLNNLKPVAPVLNKDLNKNQDVVSPSAPSKVSVAANEAKVSVKSEIPLSNDEEEVVDSKLIPTIGKEDVFAVTTVADLEDINGVPEPADKDPELYNDMESDGEYSKLEYDEDGFYDSSKNKKQEEPDSGKISKPAVAENEPPKYDVFPQRNSFGRGSGDILSTFPEQEDSHFFFYFLSLVLILMVGYLLFHNKQKIIALIVEGRHERRRRSHGLGYKKLETK